MMSPQELQAPEGKFRVVGVDIFDRTDWIDGDYDTETEAFKVADEKGGDMTLYYVYNDKGSCIKHTGTF